MIEFKLPNFLNEGIDFNEETKEVSYNPYYQKVVDTSEFSNPTFENLLGVEVFSIFKRKQGKENQNGNPLVYAMKNEKGWHFRSKIDEEQIFEQIDKIILKFAKFHPISLTILIPSSNPLNLFIANRIKGLVPNCEIITNVFRKLTVDEVRYDLFDTLYREEDEGHFYNLTKNLSNEKQKTLEDEINLCLDKMKEERNGIFSFHATPLKIRTLINRCLEIEEPFFADNAEKINHNDVLIIDDLVSQGKTLSEAINLIQKVFIPSSIKVLTLFSKAKN